MYIDKEERRERGRDTLNRSVLSFCTASKETGNKGCEKERRKHEKKQKITKYNMKLIQKIN